MPADATSPSEQWLYTRHEVVSESKLTVVIRPIKGKVLMHELTERCRCQWHSVNSNSGCQSTCYSAW